MTKHFTTYFALNEGIYDCLVLEIQMAKVLKDKLRIGAEL
jgi:hypothetical protein